MIETRYGKSGQLEGCICDIVTYTTEFGGYTTVSYMNELYEIMAEERLASYAEKNTPPWRRK